MIIQSIASLDVLDKQLNTYAMRVKEWVSSSELHLFKLTQ
jgi:RNA processing factor Prp31